MHPITTSMLSAVLLTAPCVAHAATLHARVNGSGDCSRIQNCVDRLKAGDTLLIHTGRYGGFDVKAMSGTSTSPITIKAAPGEHAVIDAALGAFNFGAVGGATIMGSSPKYIVIGDSDGVLEVTNTLPFVDEVRRLDMGKKADADTFNTRYRPDWRAKLKAIRWTNGKAAHHITVQYLRVHHFNGLAFSGCGAYGDRYIGNHVYDIGYPSSGYGWYCDGDNHLWRGNVIHDATVGVHLYIDTSTHLGAPGLTNSVFENNIVYNIGLKPWFFGLSNGKYNIKRGGFGILSYPGTSNIFRNNIVHRVDGAGISVRGNTHKLYNNTVYSTTVDMLLQSSNSDVKNNIFFKNSSSGNASWVSTNLIGIDPRFVNPSAGDFHLRPDSPARDHGLTLADVPTDAEGNRRGVGGTQYDMGAYEYRTGSASRTPPRAPKGLFVR